MEFSAVPADQLAGIGITLSGVDLARRGGQRHLHADAAGARAHVPQDIAGTHGQFGQYGGADLLLGHRRFAADEGFIRQAGHAGLRFGAGLHQQHAERRKAAARQRLHRIGDDLLLRGAKVLTNRGLHRAKACGG